MGILGAFVWFYRKRRAEGHVGLPDTGLDAAFGTDINSAYSIQDGDAEYSRL
jgi:hypothetical protein